MTPTARASSTSGTHLCHNTYQEHFGFPLRPVRSRYNRSQPSGASDDGLQLNAQSCIIRRNGLECHFENGIKLTLPIYDPSLAFR